MRSARTAHPHVSYEKSRASNVRAPRRHSQFDAAEHREDCRTRWVLAPMGHRSIISGGQRSRWAISARGTEKPAAMLDAAQAFVAADDGRARKAPAPGAPQRRRNNGVDNDLVRVCPNSSGAGPLLPLSSGSAAPKKRGRREVWIGDREAKCGKAERTKLLSKKLQIRRE